MNHFLVLSIVGHAILLVNVIVYFKSFIRNDKAFKIFSIYLAFSFCIQIATLVIGKGFHLPNLYLSHFYIVGQFVLLSLFYFQLLKNKLILFVIPAIVALIGIQFILDPSLFFRYNPVGIVITQVILVLYAIFYLYQSLSGKKPFIIINAGILFYLLSSTLIFASGNLVLDLDISENTRFILINVNRVFILLLQILIFTEWYRNYRPALLSR